MLAGRFEPWWSTLSLTLWTTQSLVQNLSDTKSNSCQWFEERGHLERRGSPSRGELEEMRVIERSVNVINIIFESKTWIQMIEVDAKSKPYGQCEV